MQSLQRSKNMLLYAAVNTWREHAKAQRRLALIALRVLQWMSNALLSPFFHVSMPSEPPGQKLPRMLLLAVGACKKSYKPATKAVNLANRNRGLYGAFS